MIKLIIREKINDAANNIIYITLLAINLTVIYILISGGFLIEKISESQWFKSTAKGYVSTDGFYIQKITVMKLLGKYFILVAVAILIAVMIYVIVSHMNKWISGMSLLHTIGYKKKYIVLFVMIKNGCDILASGVLGYILTGVAWHFCVEKIVFGKIIQLSNVKFTPDIRLYIICMVIIYAMQMIKGMSIYRGVRVKNIKQCVEE